MNSYKCCTQQTRKNTKILSQLTLLKLLADQNRLQILCILNNNQHNVSEIMQHLNVSQSLISHHLITLKKMQLVQFIKVGRHVLYSLTNKGQQVLQLLIVLGNKEQI
jgi:DNA-binding transcriptional ArsR family regulator